MENMAKTPCAALSDKELEWKEVSKKTVYKTPVFTVTERHSIGPSGYEGDYIVNEAVDWVIVIPVVGDSFLMVRQWRHGEQRLSTEFPGGVLESGEEAAKGAARELAEETGAVNAKLIHLGTLNPNPALFANHVHVFAAKDIEFSGKQQLDSDEFVNTMLVKQDEVKKQMAKGPYFHALMAAALCLYQNYEE